MPSKKAVAGIVNSFYGEILIGKKVRKDNKYLSEKWHLPGETLEDSETDKIALKRSIEEETGIEIIVGKYIGSHRTPKHNLVKGYECVALSYEIQAGSDLAEARWVPRNKVLKCCDKESVSLWPKKVLEYFK